MWQGRRGLKYGNKNPAIPMKSNFAKVCHNKFTSGDLYALLRISFSFFDSLLQEQTSAFSVNKQQTRLLFSIFITF